VAKLTKPQIAAHKKACALLEKDRLTEDEREFVFDNWMESATHINSAAGAFFTPLGLARDFSIETCGARILDLCAGIGSLARAAYDRSCWDKPAEIVCVEINPDYAAIGRKLLPEATWIVADVFALPEDLGAFDCVISNPPFGRIAKAGKGPRYTGADFEYALIDVASDLAPYGAFIIPQMSAPFAYSGLPTYERTESDKYRRFVEQTGIELGANCGIDCSYYEREWRGTAPNVEIVTADFEAVQTARQAAREADDQLDLFGRAA
jgi:predicted RNA methylase